MENENFDIEVCFTPEMFPFRQLRSAPLVVVVDVFRASTTICRALQIGIKRVYPVPTEGEAMAWQEKGYKVAAERQGRKLDFADFGNSPTGFFSTIDFDNLVLTTTNGTKAIEAASNEQQVLIGSFCNFNSLSNYLSAQPKDLVILCSGWNGSFSLEDTVFAGALAEKLKCSGFFKIDADSTRAAVDLWEKAKPDLQKYMASSQHYQRLLKLGLEKDLQFCLQMNTTEVIPYLENDYLTDIKK